MDEDEMSQRQNAEEDANDRDRYADEKYAKLRAWAEEAVKWIAGSENRFCLREAHKCSCDLHGLLSRYPGQEK